MDTINGTEVKQILYFTFEFIYLNKFCIF